MSSKQYLALGARKSSGILVAVLFLAGLLVRPGHLLAQPTVIGLGDGSDGPLDVAAGELVVNSYAILSQAVAVGGTVLELDAVDPLEAPFTSGDVVLLHRTTGFGDSPAVVAEKTEIDFENTDAIGRYALARLASVNGTTLTLTQGLTQSFPGSDEQGVTQVVRVPQYTTVNVGVTGRLTAKPWDGLTGGILAFLANAAVTNSGNIDTNGRGYRGGVRFGSNGNNGCTALVAPPFANDSERARYGEKGEGILAIFGSAARGRGALANGGGGGICHNSGGGGGGHGGQGGQGGRSWQGDGSRDVGGLGGAKLIYNLGERAFFGGGGGAGQQNNNQSTDGGHGGGWTWFRATTYSGAGEVSANGATAANAGNDGMGGGGAGGLVTVLVSASADCSAASSATFSARGGNGGTTSAGLHGPGGGGAGGRVRLQLASSHNCELSVASGQAGSQPNATAANAYGAGPETVQESELDGESAGDGEAEPVPTPPALTVTEPAQDGTATPNRMPVFAGTTEPGAHLSVTARLAGSPVAGLLDVPIDVGGDGAWVFSVPADLADGAYTFAFTATGELESSETIRALTVDGSAPAVALNSPDGNVTVGPRPTFSGTVDNVVSGIGRLEVVLTTAVGTPVFREAAVLMGHSFSFMPGSDLATDDYRVVIEAEDGAGNVTITAGRTFSVDAAVPNLEVAEPTPGLLTNAQQPVVRGTASANVGTVQIRFIDFPGTEGFVDETASVNSEGEWSLALPVLAEGAYTLEFSATSPTSVAAAPVVVSFVVDRSAPVVTLGLPAAATTVGPRPTFQGTVSDVISGIAGVEVVVFGATGDEVSRGAPMLVGDAFSLTLAVPLGNGDYTVEVEATDGAGNLTTTAPRAFTVDALVPNLAVLAPVPGSATNAALPQIIGTVSLNVFSVMGTFTDAPDGALPAPVSGVVNASGEFVLEYVDGTGPLAAGSYTLEVRAENNLGVSAPPVSISFVVDREAPSVALATAPEATSTDGTPTFSGTAADNDAVAQVRVTVTPRDGGEPLVWTVPVVDGAYTFTVPRGQRLAPGTYDYVVEAEDRAGNRSEPVTGSFNVLAAEGPGTGDPDAGEPGSGTGEPGPGAGGPGTGPDDDDTLFSGRGGLAGGSPGCALAAGASVPALLWFVLLVGLVALRRRGLRRAARGHDAGAANNARLRAQRTLPRVLGLAAAVCALFGGESAVHAQSRITLNAYRPAETTEDGFALSRPIDRGHMKFGFLLTADYAKDPLVFERARGDRGSDPIGLVDHQVTGTLNVSLGLWNRLVLFGGVPVALWQSGSDIPELGIAGAGSSPALGDAFGGFRVRLLGERADRFGLAVQFTAVSPTGRAVDAGQRYVGENSFMAVPELLFEARVGPVELMANAGFRLRTREARLPTLEIMHEFTYGVGAALPLLDELLKLYLEGFGASELKNFADRERSPIEALLGVRVYPGQGWAVGVAGGTGFQRGYGSPEVRGVLQVGWSAPVEEAAAPAELPPPPPPAPVAPPPPADADGDGILDDVDKCPNEPEDFDGFEDEDGCPDPDNDGDGILDADDKCPNEPEDFDGFEDEDGCPEPDNDGDGVPDAEDKCPMTPGPASNDGCPEKAALEGDRIVIRDRIEFDTGRASIAGDGLSVLEDVRSILATNPHVKRIRIEGHTDSRGNARKNLKLSQQRADTVMVWLIDSGIAPDRLESKGFGDTKPIDTNKTKAGRQANRRVEFHVVNTPPPAQPEASLQAE